MKYSKIEITVSHGGDNILNSSFDPFVEKSSIPVMARGMMERALNPDQLNHKFAAVLFPFVAHGQLIFWV